MSHTFGPLRLIANMGAGRGAVGTALTTLTEHLAAQGMAFDVVQTTAAGHATQAARDALADGVRYLAAVGGDGTVHEVANGLLNAREERDRGQAGTRPQDRGIGGPALAVVPIGTGNDFAKLVGPLGDLEASLDIVAGGTLRRLDACRAVWSGSTHWFVNAAGTGIDVEVVRQLLRKRMGPGVLTYVAALLRALVRYRAIPLRVRLDDRVAELEAMIVAAGNGRSVGGGFWLCPNAEPDDGRFDICIVRRTSYIESLRVLPMILRGTHAKHPKVEMHRANRVEIEALGPDPLFFQLDGELHEPPDARTLIFEMVPGALPVLSSTEVV